MLASSCLGHDPWRFRSAAGCYGRMPSTLRLPVAAAWSLVTGRLGAGLIYDSLATVGPAYLPMITVVAMVIPVLPRPAGCRCWCLPFFFALGGSGLDSVSGAAPCGSLELSLSYRASSVGQPVGKAAQGHWAHRP